VGVKYRVKDYAKSLAGLLSEEKIPDKKLTVGFIKLLERQGDLNKAKQIIKQAEFLLAKKQGKKSVVFETARKITESQKKSLAKFVDKGDIIKEKVNSELIAGVKIIMDGEEQLDMSLQKKLQDIFEF
jgi:F0F1-type ATP synthase delta subunit